MLAVWAVPMPAGMRHEALIWALGTLQLHHRAGFSSTAAQCGQRLTVLGLQSAVIRSKKISGIAFNDVGKAGHLTLPQVMAKPLIKVLMRSIA